MHRIVCYPCRLRVLKYWQFTGFAAILPSVQNLPLYRYSQGRVPRCFAFAKFRCQDFVGLKSCFGILYYSISHDFVAENSGGLIVLSLNSG